MGQRRGTVCRRLGVGVARLVIVAATIGAPLVATAVMTRSAAAASRPFVVGAGKATAAVISVPLALAGENEGVNQGLSLADYDDNEGQAESQTLTSALFSAVPTSLPASLTGIEAESSATKVSTTKTLAGDAGVGAGTESAVASKSSGMATTALAGISIANVLTVSGGQSSAFSGIVDGNIRESVATSQIGSISFLGGLVTLSGLQWSSIQRSGAESTNSSTFSIGSLKVSGVQIPTVNQSLASLLVPINAVLAPTGFALTLPKAIGGSAGTTQEGALDIGIDNSELGQKIVGPLISDVQPLRTVVINALTGANSTLGDANLYLEIVLGVLAGQGNLDIDLGGTYATTNDATYSDPFGTGLGTSTLFNPTTPDTTQPPSPFFGVAPSGAGPGAPIPTSGSTGRTATAPLRYVPLARTTACQSTTTGSCRSSSPTVVVIVLLAATGLLVLAEFTRQRLRKRSFAGIPDGPIA